MRRAGLVLAPLLWLSAVPTSAQAERPSEAEVLMHELSEHFRSLEQRLGESDLDRTAAIADEVRALLRGPLPFAGGDVPLDVLAAQVARLDEAVVELTALARQGNLLGAGQALDGLRAACVSCHVRYRPENDVRGDFPARENTVTGIVELNDADGEPRTSRAWVLVFLEGPPLDPPFVHARENPRISQSARRFEPRVLPVTVGTRVEFPNDDTIFHNVFSLSKTAPFDLGVYEPGRSASVHMQRTGLVKVYCNIHPEMAASIVVLDNPWFALTDASGRFVICGVTDGEYVLRAWNDMGAESRAPLQLRGARVFDARIELRETRRSLTHLDKHGSPYPSKYR